MNKNIMWGRFCTRKGFTLIELLVVVLIIGILAAVAVPQYQKVVEKGKMTETLALGRAIYAAQQVYFLANDEYATNLASLDLDLPADITDKYDVIMGTSGVGGRLFLQRKDSLGWWWDFQYEKHRIVCSSEEANKIGVELCKSMTGGTSIRGPWMNGNISYVGYYLIGADEEKQEE